MSGIGRLTALAVALLSAVGLPDQADSQITTDAAGLRDIGQDLVSAGLAEDAALVAEALLARDPQDAEALIIAAQAALLTGRNEAAVDFATRAHAGASGPVAYVAARLAATGHAQLEQYTLSQIWLRRARQAAPDEAAIREIAEDYRFVRERNPLNVQLTFGIAPSSNVNSGSASETIVLPGLPFEFILSGDARALSGLQISGGAALSYRLSVTESSATFANLQLQGRTYALSDSAKEQAPNARGSDYADIYLSTGLTHRWRTEVGGPIHSVTGNIGQIWYGGDPYSRFATLSYEWDKAIADRQRLALQGFLEWNERLTDGADYPTAGVRARWTVVGESGNRTTLSLTLREAMTDRPDLGFQGGTLSAQYDLAQPIGGMQLGFGAELDYRDFTGSIYSFDGRTDLRQTLRASAALTQINIFGFEPVVSIEASRTDSNIPLFEKDDLRVNFGLRSSF